MNGSAQKKSGRGVFKFRDFLVILFCLSGAAISLNLFRLDLFRTFNSIDAKPVGTVVNKYNNVQRRMTDRIVWDRLVNETPVYPGDVIRIAKLSGAVLYIDGASIELNENTLIRIQTGEGPPGIELASGSLSLNSAADSNGILLNIMGHQLEAGPGTVLSAVSGEDGMLLRVSEGRISLSGNEGEKLEADSGMAISLDTSGNTRMEPLVVVFYPEPSAYYINSEDEPLNVNFAWNRINMEAGETLRLEISEDRNFTRITQAINGLNAAAAAAFNTGLWYWRLIHEDIVLGGGRISIVDGRGPALVSPAVNSQLIFDEEPPEIQFRWSEIEGASYYLEAAETLDFINPRISNNVWGTSFINSNLGPGTWFWRVRPVFPSGYEGNPVFSAAASFRVVERALLEEEAAILPVVHEEAEIIPEPVYVPQPVTLISPANGASIQGLTALRQQTIFRWTSEDEVGSSRFVLSRNSNPLAGNPAVEIRNPARTVNIDSLGEGLWYWTVEAETPEGHSINAVTRQLRVLAIPLLPAAGNRRPLNGTVIKEDELRNLTNLVFNWSAVEGANAYIFSLYHQTAGGRRLIIRSEPVTRTIWTVTDLRILEPGTFVWQIEALNRDRNGRIDQRGRTGENSFVIDMELPERIRPDDPGVLYGN